MQDPKSDYAPSHSGWQNSSQGQARPNDRTGATPADQSVRPRDAAISCSHFWAFVLIIAGIAEAVVGAIIFSEWENVGSLWVGVSSIAAGIAGAFVTGGRPSGGPGTAFFLALAFLTLVASLGSVILGDGVTYAVVRETGGNCIDSSGCSDNACVSRDCVCWEPDGTSYCEAEAATSVRYCLRFAGSCADIGDTESLLLGSSIALIMVAWISLMSFFVAAATCCSCKRIILANTTNNAQW